MQTKQPGNRKLFIQSQLDGKHIEVTAIGTDDGAVNDWLARNPGQGVVDRWGGLILTADCSDFGIDPPAGDPSVREALLRRVNEALSWAFQQGYCFGEGAGEAFAQLTGQKVDIQDNGMYSDTLKFTKVTVDA